MVSNRAFASEVSDEFLCCNVLFFLGSTARTFNLLHSLQRKLKI